MLEKMNWKAWWTIRKWNDEDSWNTGKDPKEIVMIENNDLLNEGINELWTLVCSSSGTKFDNGNAYLGVGTSSAAFDPTQTDLQGTKTYVAMDGSYPTYGTSQKAVWKSTFTALVGNHAWEEFTVCNGSSGTGKNLNRKLSSQGTKVSGQVWELTLEITLS